MASDFADNTPYHYVHNNPILLTDPFGLNADSTRIYNLEGMYRGTINDSYQNEEHFLSNQDAHTALNMEGTESEKASFARRNSKFYVGAQTRLEMEYVENVSEGDEMERMFLMTYTEDCRELCVVDATHRASNRSANGITPPGDVNLLHITAKPGTLVGYGHTHGLYSLGKGQTSTFSLRRPSDPKDYYDNLDMGRYPLFIAFPNGYTIYNSNRRGNRGQSYGNQGNMRDATSSDDRTN